jgi:hypothetical protein
MWSKIKIVIAVREKDIKTSIAEAMMAIYLSEDSNRCCALFFSLKI